MHSSTMQTLTAAWKHMVLVVPALIFFFWLGITLPAFPLATAVSNFLLLTSLSIQQYHDCF